MRLSGALPQETGRLIVFNDVQFGQCCTKLLHAALGHLGSCNAQLNKICQSAQLSKPGIGERSVAQVKPVQPPKSPKLRDSGVGDWATIQVKIFELG